MKAKLKVNEFARAVKLCANAIEVKDMKRSNIQFEAHENNMRVRASNSTYSITMDCPCELEEEGSAVVDGKMAYSVISKGSSECSVTADDKNMVIKTSGKTKLPNLDIEIPMIEDVKGKSINFDSVEFKNAINRIEYAISEDQSRLILTGAHIVIDGEKAVFTSLDGFRLAQTTIPCTGDSIDIVVPFKVLSAICDAITDGNLIINHNNIHISAIGEGFAINAVILQGAYIDTEKIIPKSFKTSVLVNTENLKQCMDSATVASSTTNLVKLSIADDCIKVSSNSESAEFQGDTDAMIDGDDICIAFNLKYFLQMLAHIETEQCELKLNTSVSPAVVVPHGTKNSDMALILPVRIFN